MPNGNKLNFFGMEAMHVKIIKGNKKIITYGKARQLYGDSTKFLLIIDRK